VPLKPANVLEWMMDAETPNRAALPQPPARSSGISGQGSTVVRATPQKVWSALLDETKLREAIPGCRSLERVSENAFTATVVLGVGPVTGVFDAEVGLFDLDEPRSALLKGRLSGSLGAASGTGRLTLVPRGQDCRIDHQYDIHLSGRVAMIGGRMLDGAARQLINAFLRRFVVSLEPTTEKAAAIPWLSRWRAWLGASR
jgi:2-furoyl-CoA dehydrogenase large subunit